MLSYLDVKAVAQSLGEKVVSLGLVEESIAVDFHREVPVIIRPSFDLSLKSIWCKVVPSISPVPAPLEVVCDLMRLTLPIPYSLAAVVG